MLIKTEVPKAYYTTVGTVALLEFLIGSPLNVMCVWYFARKSLSYRSAVNCLFVAISIIDLIMCSIMIIPGIAAFHYGNPGPFSNVVICNLWGVVWHTGGGMSVFLMAVLAITRWRVMVFPLRKVRKGYIRLAIGVYTVIQIFKSTFNYWYKGGNLYRFNKYVLGCKVNIINGHQITDIDKLCHFLLYVCEILVPAVITVIFSLATLITLRNSKKGLQKNEEILRSYASEETSNASKEPRKRKLGKRTRRRHATNTVLLLVLVFVLFNMWFWAFLLGDAIFVYSGGRISYVVELWGTKYQTGHGYQMTYATIYTHTLILNCVTNAVIYITRLQGLQGFARKKISAALRVITHRTCT